MSIFPLWHNKTQEEKPFVLRRILGNPEVNNIIDHFLAHDVAKAKSIIIIWTTDNDVKFAMGGLSQINVEGLLHHVAVRVNVKGF